MVQELCGHKRAGTVIAWKHGFTQQNKQSHKFQQWFVTVGKEWAKTVYMSFAREEYKFPPQYFRLKLFCTRHCIGNLVA